MREYQLFDRGPLSEPAIGFGARARRAWRLRWDEWVCVASFAPFCVVSTAESGTRTAGIVSRTRSARRSVRRAAAQEAAVA